MLVVVAVGSNHLTGLVLVGDMAENLVTKSVMKDDVVLNAVWLDKNMLVNNLLVLFEELEPVSMVTSPFKTSVIGRII